MKRINVLAYVHLYPPTHCAGAEMGLHSMLRPLADRGHRVAVKLGRFQNGAQPHVLDGVQVIPRRLNPQAKYAISQADIIVSHLDFADEARKHSEEFSKPFVYLAHNDHEYTRDQIHSYRNDLVVYNSDWMADDIGSAGITVRPPIWVDDYRIEQPGSKITLINMNEGKGANTFYRLAALMPDREFLAIEGAYGDQIRKDLPNVEWRNHGTDMRDVYASTRILIMPSVYESWGRTANEACVAGIPTIAAPTPGLLECLGDAGTFVDHKDAAGYATAIAALDDGRKYNAASKRALKRADELEALKESDLARWVEAVEQLGR